MPPPSRHSTSAVPGHGDSAVDGFQRVIGHSKGITQAVHKARLLSRVDAPLLLQGETGVGKEVFARAIHDSGSQRSGPFIVLNCGGLSRDLLASELFGYSEGAFTGARRGGMTGKIEAANAGNLFLDEISEMPLDLQPYLLRVLEDGEVSPLGSSQSRTVRFRLISACNRDLRSDVASGRFRSDLFYRVSVTRVDIPALRERPDDIPDLVEHFAEEIATHHGLRRKRMTREVMAAFGDYSWLGNIRELRNVVETMMLMSDGDVVDVSVLPPELLAPRHRDSAPTTSAAGLKGVEREAIAVAIAAHGGNLSRVAVDLRISKSTLYLKLKQYSLEVLVDDVRKRSR